jgi:hypothetical protein
MPKQLKEATPEGAKIATVEVRNQVFDIYVNNRGNFNTVVDGHAYSADTKTALVEKLTVATKIKAAKIAIAFVRAEDAVWSNDTTKIKHGVVTGRHSGTRNLLIKWDGAKGVDQESCRSDEKNTNFLRLTAEEEKEFAQMYAEKEVIKNKISAFEKKHAINIYREVGDAIKKAGVNQD